MVSNLEQKRFSSLGLRKWFLFRGSGWNSGAEPREVEVEEKGLLKWSNPFFGSSFSGTCRGAPLSGVVKVMKGRFWE